VNPFDQRGTVLDPLTRMSSECVAHYEKSFENRLVQTSLLLITLNSSEMCSDHSRKQQTKKQGDNSSTGQQEKFQQIRGGMHLTSTLNKRKENTGPRSTKYSRLKETSEDGRT
jgi:hypothetical protein